MANSQTITINVKAIADMSDVLSNTKQIQNALSQLKLPPNLKASFIKSFGDIEKEVAKVQTILNKPTKSKSDVTGLEKGFDKINTLLLQLQANMGKINPKILQESLTIDTKKLDEANKKVADLQKKLTEAVNLQASGGGLESLKKYYEDFEKLGRKSSAAKDFIKFLDLGQIDQAEAKLKKLESAIQGWKTSLANKKEQNLDTGDLPKKIEDYEKLAQTMRKVYDSISGGTVNKLQQDLEQARNAVNNLSDTELQGLITKFQQLTGVDLTNIINDLSTFGNEATGAATAQAQLNSELSQVKSRIQYFLGLNNAINLFRRALRGAFNTVKELDKAMTETAVVTNFTVGDMWSQLPRYTQVANELGVTTKGAYETMTLFYQQGLDTNEAFALGTETMKMARIAGLDYKDATDAMTAALRGFNMELNETSAQRVNDVYSQLAAKTASDVEEISTAMTKVASIAHNAGMEFETTSAFLSQIIETTREAPETAGTALKTVIARFTELKKPLDEIGEVDGEAVDANKIETALKSVGVALRDAKGEFRDLDDVFIELSSRWNGLTKNQQRYVATMAAGSRQQSRFIAMMSDYNRTQELIGEAYDSSGASQKQYEKTLESLESKLNKLKNAWNEFLMGLTNSTVIKGGVDLLTNLLNGLNKLTTGFNESSSSILKWIATFAGFGSLRLAFSDKGPIAGLLKGTIFGNMLGLTRGASGTAEKLNLLGGLKQRFSSIKNGISTFKNNSIISDYYLDPRYQAARQNYFNLRQTQPNNLEAISVARNQIFSAKAAAGGVAPKTLFGALGNRFVNTNLGASLSSGLGAIFNGGTALGGAATLATSLGIATAAAVALGVAIKAAYDASPAGQLKAAQKWADSLKQVESAAQKAAASLKQTAEEYSSITERVDNATSVEERTAAIQEQNEYIQQLVESNKEYSKFVNSEFKDGQLVLSFDKESLDAAIEAAEAGLKQLSIETSFADATVAEKQIKVYQSKMASQGVNLESNTIQDYDSEGVAYLRQMSEAETRYWQGIQVEIQKLTSEITNYAKNAYSEMLEDSGLEDSVANGLTNFLANTYDSEERHRQVEIEKSNLWDEFGINKKDLRDEYARVFGTEADESLTRKQLRAAIAEARVDAATEVDVDAIAAQIMADTTGKYGSYFSALGGDFGGKSTLGKSLKDVLPEFSGSLIAEIADAVGAPAAEVTKQLYDQFKLQQRQEAQAALISSRSIMGSNSENLRGRYLDVFGIDNADWRQQIGALVNKFDSELSGENILNAALDSMLSGDWEESGLAAFVNSLDFSNPIAAMDTLKIEAQDTSTAIGELANDIIEAESASGALSAANQVQYLLTSESFNELNEDIEEFREENGKITPKYINELRKSCGDLDTLLDNTAISANGLANILNSIGDGAIGFNDISNSLIAAAEAMNTLDSFTSGVIDDLNNFQPGYDENDVTKFIGTASDFVNEQIEKGAYGNNAMQDYIKKIFGEDAFRDESGNALQGKAYEAQLQKYATALGRNKENMYSAWSSYIDWFGQNGDILQQAGFNVWKENGEIKLDPGELTTEELRNALSSVVESQGGSDIFTDEFLDMMIVDFKNYSSDFKQIISENDLPEAIGAWAESLGKNAKDEFVYTQDQLEALAKFLGVSTEDIEAELKEQQQNVSKIDWDISDKASARKSVKELAQEEGSATSNMWMLGVKDETGKTREPLINFDATKQAMDDADLAGQFHDTINTMIEVGDSFVTQTAQGFQTVTRQAGESAEEAAQRVKDQFADRALADETSKALTNVPVNVNDEEAQGKIKGLIDAINAISDSTNPVPIEATDNASSVIQIVLDYLDRLPSNKVVDVTVYRHTTSDDGTVALGGYVTQSAYASGTRKVQPGPALTGEEGPEIVWNKEKGYAYITGENHPEFQNLKPGDRIFNAQETRKILGSAAKGGYVNSYSTASGYGGAKKSSSGSSKKTSSSSGSGSSSSSSSSSSQEADVTFWKAELDWLYNLVQDISALERKQTEYAARQEQYLKDHSKNGHDLVKLAIKQLGNLTGQLQSQKAQLKYRQQEMKEFMTQTNEFPKLLRWNTKDNTLEVDWDAVQNLSEEEYKTFDEQLKIAENIHGEITDAESKIVDIEGQIQDFQHLYRDERIKFEQRIEEALISQKQDVIDNYKDLSDTLSDSNSKILSSLSQQVALSRQIRDNTKTEENISDMESRLAYLRRDTTGGNQAEIMKLEKELQDAQESYQDTLVDQAIDRLKTDNDEAAEQRQQQIDIMQAQLDYQAESGAFNKEIQSLIKGAVDGDGNIRPSSELMTLLQTSDDFSAQTAAEQGAWMDSYWDSLTQSIASLDWEKLTNASGKVSDENKEIADEIGALLGAENSKLVSRVVAAGANETKNLKAAPTIGGQDKKTASSAGGKGSKSQAEEKISVDKDFTGWKQNPKNGDWYYFTEGKGKEQWIKSNGKWYWTNSSGKMQTGVITDSKGDYYYLNSSGALETGWKQDPQTKDWYYTNSKGNAVTQWVKSSGKWYYVDHGKMKKGWAKIGSDIYYLDPKTGAMYTKGTYTIDKTKYTFKNGGALDQSKLTKKQLAAIKKAGGFLSGGLTSKTGLAMLHGTPSQPEYVLNAKQTEAFLKLADILPSFMTNAGGVNGNLGNINLNLVMNVDEIGSDYDVDRIAGRVKEIIYNASSYRNVNTLNFLR